MSANPPQTDPYPPLPRVLLVAGTKIEVQAVLDAFKEASGSPWQRKFINKKVYYALGQINGLEAFLVQSETGVAGPGETSQSIQQAIQDLTPVAVILVGVAFGVSPSTQKLGDILVATQLQSYGVPPTAKGNIELIQQIGSTNMPIELLSLGDLVSTSPALLDKFRSGDLDWQGAKVHFGLILSGMLVIDDQQTRDQLLVLAPSAIGGEMEGAGLYGVVQEAGVDWILVKAIDDFVDGTKDEDVRDLAAHNAVSFVLHVIQATGLGLTEPPSQVSFSVSQSRTSPSFQSPSETENHVPGIDVSQLQGSLDWHRVQRAGVVFAFAKATQGLQQAEQWFIKNWSAMQAAGLIRGAYLVLDPQANPSDQADLFTAVVKKLEANDLPPALDLSMLRSLNPPAKSQNASPKIDREKRFETLVTCLVNLERGLGRKPVIYTDLTLWNDLVEGHSADDLSWLDHYPLWLTQYTDSSLPLQSSAIPRGWSRWTFWQYTNRGRIAGISAETNLNWFNGSRADLIRFIETSKADLLTSAQLSAAKGRSVSSKWIQQARQGIGNIFQPKQPRVTEPSGPQVEERRLFLARINTLRDQVSADQALPPPFRERIEHLLSESEQAVPAEESSHAAA